jgi:hypothetical protein
MEWSRLNDRKIRNISIFGAIVYKRFVVVIWASNMSLIAVIFLSRSVRQSGTPETKNCTDDINVYLYDPQATRDSNRTAQPLPFASLSLLLLLSYFLPRLARLPRGEKRDGAARRSWFRCCVRTLPRI